MVTMSSAFSVTLERTPPRGQLRRHQSVLAPPRRNLRRARDRFAEGRRRADSEEVLPSVHHPRLRGLCCASDGSQQRVLLYPLGTSLDGGGKSGGAALRCRFRS